MGILRQCDQPQKAHGHGELGPEHLGMTATGSDSAPTYIGATLLMLTALLQQVSGLLGPISCSTTVTLGDPLTSLCCTDGRNSPQS